MDAFGRQLWEAVEVRIGTYLPKASNKWLQYLLDFIQTTRNLSSAAMNDSLPNDQFFIENNEAIERLIAERSHFIERLNRKVADLKTRVCGDEELRNLLSKGEIYCKSVLAMYLNAFGNRPLIGMDLEISPKGWGLTIFERSGSEFYLTQIIERSDLLHKLRSCKRATNGRRIVEEWDLDTKIEEISSRANSIRFESPPWGPPQVRRLPGTTSPLQGAYA